jgi:Ca2+-binding EF-hand superfamily protein
MNIISLLVAVCLVLSVCINMTASNGDVSYIFGLFDCNKDMAIDKEEINKFASKYLGNVDLTPYIKYFKEADKNGDGRIQFNEFKTIYSILKDLPYF